MFRRNHGRTNGQLIRSELADSFGHLRLAGAHAVAGTAGVIVPRAERAGRAAGRLAEQTADRVVTVAVEPVVTGVRDVARRGRPKRWRDARIKSREFAGMTGRRWSMVVGGLVVAGVAAGAATALVRRRRAAEAGFPAESAGPVGNADLDDLPEQQRPVADPAAGLDAEEAAEARERTSDLIGGGRTGR